MSDPLIQGCEVRFQFQCPKRWDALGETPEAGVRSCDQCQKRVYLCRDTREVAQHARAGHCIAVPAWVLSDFQWAPALRHLVPREVARKHCLLPLRLQGHSIVVAMSDPTNTHALDEVKFFSGYSVEAVAASRQEIERILDQADLEDSREVLLGMVDWEP